MPTSPNNIQQYPTFLTKVKLCPTSSNNTQHHPTMPNMGGQTIPTFIPNIVGICWAKMLASFGQGLRPRLHGNGSMWNLTRTVQIGLAFTRKLMDPFHTEPLAVPELVHLESRSRTEPNQKFSCKLPEPFSSGTLRNKAKGNSTEDS